MTKEKEGVSEKDLKALCEELLEKYKAVFEELAK